MAHSHVSPTGIEPVTPDDLDEDRRVSPHVPDDRDEDDSREPPMFCSFTFGQFFTMLVLLVVTVCGVFYLGARYGNRYLRLDQFNSTAAQESRAEYPPFGELPDGRPNPDDAVERVRAALQQQQQQKLEAQVQRYLQNPATAPLGAAPPQALPPPVQPATTYASGQAPIGTPSIVGPDPTAVADSAGLPYIAEANRPPLQATQPDLVHAAHPGEHVVGINAAQPAVQFQGSAGLPYAVQVAAYRDIREAQAKVNEWQSKGYPAYVTEAQLADKGKWYRVRVGAFATRDEASSYLTKIQQTESIDAMIVGQ